MPNLAETLALTSTAASNLTAEQVSAHALNVRCYVKQLNESIAGLDLEALSHEIEHTMQPDLPYDVRYAASLSARDWHWAIDRAELTQDERAARDTLARLMRRAESLFRLALTEQVTP